MITPFRKALVGAGPEPLTADTRLWAQQFIKIQADKDNAGDIVVTFGGEIRNLMPFEETVITVNRWDLPTFTESAGVRTLNGGGIIQLNQVTISGTATDAVFVEAI